MFCLSFVFGVLADKIGRRHTLLLAVLCCATGNIIGVGMPNHWSYAIPRVNYGNVNQLTNSLVFLLDSVERGRGGRVRGCVHDVAGVRGGE